MKANEIINKASKVRNGFQAFEISPESRAKLAESFPPKFSEFIGHHITYKFGVKSDMPLPTDEGTNFRVVGYACNDEGLEALVVEVDGSTVRPDGKTFHVTWSLDREAGFKPVNSNDLLKRGWQSVSAINITATAKFF